MSKPRYDPRVPLPEDCVLRPLLDRRARETPDKVFVRFADGVEWTYRQTREIARRTAIGFQSLGIAQGHNVLSWLPNGADALRVWFGLNYIGAVYVPINLAYRGGVLKHVVENSDARLIVAHADLLGRLADIDRAALTTAVVLGGAAPVVPGLAIERREIEERERTHVLPGLAQDGNLQCTCDHLKCWF